ncbi:MAG: site-specific integrase [Ekhidna sp.]|nr:site-specific integrase [Ekhidna sp.]
MKTHIILSLDKRRQKKDGTYPIVLRLTHKRRTTSIKTGYEVPEKAWDESKKMVRTSYRGFENVTRVNNTLHRKRGEALDTITKLEDKKELVALSVTGVKERILGRYSKVTFYSYTQRLIDEFVSKGRIGNARSYKNVLREVRKFTKDVDFGFEELTYDFLQRFDTYYLSKGCSENGLAVYMRTIRAIFNRAIKDNIVDSNSYPFQHYTIRTKPTKKRAINYQAIQKIIQLEINATDPLFHARNYFLMSFYLMGAPFSDMANLKLENIVDGRIRYRRRKTSKYYDIKVSDQLKSILEYYLKGKKETDYILPIIKSEEIELQNKETHYALIAYNTSLKKLGKRVGIQEELTSYVSRHSFASLANDKAIPLTAISEMLGHQSVKTTQVYLASLGSKRIDDFNDQIINDL